MNLCINCKYFRDSKDTKQVARCYHPKCGIDPVYGLVESVPALLQRSDGLCVNSYCGKEGKWYVQKDVDNSKPWWMWYRS
jgi:hypothetical protein